jgi:hypothetical protein
MSWPGLRVVRGDNRERDTQIQDAIKMSSSSSRWVPRFGLRSLLVVVLFVAVLFAWYADHLRQAEALRVARVENIVYKQQIDLYVDALANRTAKRDENDLSWASADEFVGTLLLVEKEDEFLQIAGSLCRCRGTILDESVEQLCGLLADSNERNRKRAIKTLSFLIQQRSWPIARDSQTVAEFVLERRANQITRSLIALIDDGAIGEEAYNVLREFGPEARVSLDVLREKMADDSNSHASLAAAAVAEIDPEADIGPRLIELIENEHPAWQLAVSLLADHVPPAEARRVLTALYDRLEQEGDRQTVINALNEISAEASIASPAP